MKRGDGRTIEDMLLDPEYDKHLEEYPHYKINIQQAAKVKPLLNILVAGEGYFVDADIGSLEPTVIAELSGDPTYTEIYASGKPHDPYLYTAIKIMPWAAEKVNAIYNIDNPTKESVAAAKKECKTERKMAKPVFLCLAPGTPVLTKLGWKRIEDVTDKDLVWNGTKWVQCAGAAPTAVKEVLFRNGITATKDHKVLTKEGWQVHERAEASQLIRPEIARHTWKSLWQLVCGWVAYKRQGSN